ncbi:DUF2125 domain-containing protein [Magnetospirillum sp. SS-4]|uniref:DUF2125 domain-containing protein n=1 Tax=Magnetospirillum sp. SS-4 TaxID=2681465 RepID=UPI0013804867|nr:DUF2125 domain-containing protein [Magnetospirillum sp. SS-4]CAA7615568.1 conserved exported hypothetical protein [Magnetospirillum sp. SS-4]
MSVRLRIAALVLTPALVAVIGVSAYWFHAAGQLRKGIDAFAEDRRARGWVVDIAPPALGGFPATVAARLPRISLAGPSGQSWRGEDVTVTIPLLDPLAPVVGLAGIHRLSVGGWNGIVSAKIAEAHLALAPDGRLKRLDLAVSQAAMEQPGASSMTLGSAALGIEWLFPPDPGHDKASLAISLGLRGLDLPDGLVPLLAHRIDSAHLEARLMGTVPDGPSLAALEAWSRDGGTIELDRLTLDWAPLSIEADGTFALDPALQPLLATSSRVRGWSGLTTRLVRNGLMEPGVASAAEVMMGLMARPDAQGRPTLTIPVSVQDNILSAGQIRVLRVPPLSLPSLLSEGPPS